jgi:hypothetical protein
MDNTQEAINRRLCAAIKSVLGAVQLQQQQIDSLSRTTALHTSVSEFTAAALKEIEDLNKLFDLRSPDAPKGE